MTAGWELSGSAWLVPVLQVRSNCGISTVWPLWVRTACSRVIEQGPPPPFELPVWPTNCHDGRSMDGLSGVMIEHTTSLDPPPFGSQSSQPTLPGAVEQSGILTPPLQDQAEPPSYGELVPLPLVPLTGIAIGSRAQYLPALASQ